ncbi:C45 family autoproteolytic acyltransferase/hydolase [Actibacterium sp. XHP0104]|uniref:C45 family autoproteolytic acyltransferase/hydolase n=1 Tax=Actibacterium sp. XHP0104 TaxID=2984335 RepID=UPI0021E8F2CF|nr:C45 family peptidase [Actibacterium sp. XHP0104]MCV2881575.1 C45 family autoproteolytic acyltransferase/hydrolase [Actibacterium sp. XHP0104]
MHLTFRSLSEDLPGDAWREVFRHGWPGWSEWYGARSEGEPALADARASIRRHMPEYEPLWDELTQRCGADDEAARFLSFWSPPRYLVNCSQAVLMDEDGPVLIRNYDLDPELNEATLLSTGWQGRRVVGMVEAMAGLSDGMNDAGLALSLTFGGRVIRQTGFGIPIILRYVLQTCNDTQEAIEALRAVPSHMSYNVTLIDRSGDFATVFLAPDRPAIVSRQPWATNHQIGVEWPRHARVSNTLGRAQHLEALLERDDLTAALLEQEFNQPPLFSTNYAQGFGTVYGAIYRPAQGEVTLRWRDGTRHSWQIDAVERRQIPIHYTGQGSQAAPQAQPAEPTPAWYDAFLGTLPQSLSHTDSDVQARMAAFWRRNHMGQDQEWSNLWSASPNSQSQEET